MVFPTPLTPNIPVTFLFSNDIFRFLEKYGFEVISLDEDNTKVSDRVISDVTSLIKTGTIKHIFLFENKKNSDALEKIIKNTKVSTYEFRRLDNIKDDERDEKQCRCADL